MTLLCCLVAQEHDPLGYVTYVFECLDKEITIESRYIMCTRYPNWDHRELQIGEVGYLNFNEIRAGLDKWYDGNTMIPYRYSGIQFIKFIIKPNKKDHKYVI